MAKKSNKYKLKIYICIYLKNIYILYTILYMYVKICMYLILNKLKIKI